MRVDNTTLFFAALLMAGAGLLVTNIATAISFIMVGIALLVLAIRRKLQSRR